MPPTPDPQFITGQSRLTATVEAAVEKAVARALASRASQASAPGVGVDWLPLHRVREITGWSKATLARRRADGSLPYSLVGQSVFVHADDLNALMERHRVRAGGKRQSAVGSRSRSTGTSAT
jgi:hypothetical protein